MSEMLLDQIIDNFHIKIDWLILPVFRAGSATSRINHTYIFSCNHNWNETSSMMDNPVTVVFIVYILEILNSNPGVLTPMSDKIRQQLNKAWLIFSKIGCSSMIRKFDTIFESNFSLNLVGINPYVLIYIFRCPWHTLQLHYIL